MRKTRKASEGIAYLCICDLLSAYCFDFDRSRNERPDYERWFRYLWSRQTIIKNKNACAPLLRFGGKSGRFFPLPSKKQHEEANFCAVINSSARINIEKKSKLIVHHPIATGKMGLHYSFWFCLTRLWPNVWWSVFCCPLLLPLSRSQHGISFRYAIALHGRGMHHKDATNRSNRSTKKEEDIRNWLKIETGFCLRFAHRMQCDAHTDRNKFRSLPLDVCVWALAHYVWPWHFIYLREALFISYLHT